MFMLVNISHVHADCSVNLDGLTGKYPPLLLQGHQFIYPTSVNQQGQRTIDIDEGGELELYCHGDIRYEDSTYVSVSGLPKQKSIVLTCSQGVFYYAEDQVKVESSTCNRRQEPHLIRTNEICSPEGADGRTSNLVDLVRVQIGWKIGTNFIEQIQLCHDEANYGTIWTNHTIYGKSIEHRDIDEGRPSFRADNSYQKRFYTWYTSTKLNEQYSKRTQGYTVSKLLGSNIINSVPLIETGTTGSNYFAKGHLSPDAAFIYNVQQDATYYFMNAAPQFQAFNNGNWKALEYNARDLASRSGRDLSIHTGTFGVLSYTDVNNEDVPIYLYISGETRYIPAPLYYWKVIHDPSTGSAAAFIGLNNPHATEQPEELCNNVCGEMSWVDWSITELDSGYMYCCSVEDARKAIPSIPDIQSSGLIQME
ncbi:uncharacterized protein LOC111699940 isoform X2 [Eurytemora carolleeae]|uniref:uncharacterized protein LOC111699940 isoform X2 n=1 Tax=Eurytemora carolleeae TaxID=1294199 RepID=UPI000C75A9FF|nr:uncharacterized protein LOC111699940 isoform X2 [Eurytemora carolleeae]|eukprot:XP_023326504.1 uncharacterized protein LOC111699940 isoform X2 [Eurytemora affinis]